MKLVGTWEIQRDFGVPRHRVFRFVRRGVFPAPLARLHCGAVFDAVEVEAAVNRLKASGSLEPGR